MLGAQPQTICEAGQEAWGARKMGPPPQPGHPSGWNFGNNPFGLLKILDASSRPGGGRGKGHVQNGSQPAVGVTD